MTRHLRWAALAIVFCFFLVFAVPRAWAAHDATPSAACVTRGAPGTVTLSPVVDGMQRTIIVHMPNGESGAGAVPLVLNLHSSGSTAAQQEVSSGMDATADANGFIVAYPQAAIPEGKGFDWNVPGAPLLRGEAVPATAANDEAFLRQAVALIGRQ